MADLPLVLAGPIVRRVEARSCSFWIALSQSATVTAKIWAGPQFAGGATNSVQSGEAALGEGQAATRRFGAKLHVALVTVRFPVGTPPLAPGSLHAYNISFDAGGNVQDLKSAGLLKDEPANPRLPGVDASAPRHLALGFVQDRLPAFVTPPATVDRLRLAHGSCRKSNGPEHDALVFLDRHIGEAFLDTEVRPQQLFLTGDQIYADDLGACLLPMLNSLGQDLLGNLERIPINTGNQTQDLSCTVTAFPPLYRQRLVREQAAFTTTSGSNHLFSFGEYAGMYLAAWSPRVWRPLDDVDTTLNRPRGDGVTQNVLTEWEKCHGGDIQKWKDSVRGGLERDKARVELYRSDVPRAARLLANVATYMMMDDHEITDDWNLNRLWRNRVYSKPLGRAIVRNGMMAYGVFQGWGNDPRRFEGINAEIDLAELGQPVADGVVADLNAGQPTERLRILFGAYSIILSQNTTFSTVTASSKWQMKVGANVANDITKDGDRLVVVGVNSPNKLFLEEVEKVTAGLGPFPGADTGKLDEIVGSLEGREGSQATWHFRVNGPRHVVAVMDSRTRRTFRGQGFAPPALLGGTLGAQVPGGPMMDGRELLIVVSPAPVLGPNIIDRLGAPLSQIFHDAKASTWDRFKEDQHDPCKRLTAVAGTEEYDAEGWAANEKAQEELLEVLAKHGRAVILSGDVHYGDSLALDYWRKGLGVVTSALGAPLHQQANTGSPLRITVPDGHTVVIKEPNVTGELVALQGLPATNLWQKIEYLGLEGFIWGPLVRLPSRIVQLTASPLRNDFKDAIVALVRSNALLQRVAQGAPGERLAWKNESSIVVPQGAFLSPGRRARLKRKPSLVPARGWPPNTTMPDDKPPDWRWRLRLLRDERPDSALPPGARQPQLPASAELNVANPIAGYRAIAGRHAQAALTGFDHMRTMVFPCNVGLVKFSGGGPSLEVEHTLLSRSAPESDVPAENTVFRISLAPSQELPPVLEVRNA